MMVSVGLIMRRGWHPRFPLIGPTLVLRNLAVFHNMNLLVYFSLIDSDIRYYIVLWGSSSKYNLDRNFRITKLKHMYIRLIKKMIRIANFNRSFFFILEVISLLKIRLDSGSPTYNYLTRNLSINPSIHHSSKLFESKQRRTQTFFKITIWK